MEYLKKLKGGLRIVGGACNFLGSVWLQQKFETVDQCYSTVTAAAAKSLQSCPTLCDAKDAAAHQAPLSLGFSKQGHWSGLPFPSPMHESEKLK